VRLPFEWHLIRQEECGHHILKAIDISSVYGDTDVVFLISAAVAVFSEFFLAITRSNSGLLP